MSDKGVNGVCDRCSRFTMGRFCPECGGETRGLASKPCEETYRRLGEYKREFVNTSMRRERWENDE